MNSTIAISGRGVGAGAPVFIVAEMSANHQGDFERATQIVREAKRCGADAIKLQTFTPDTMTIQSNEDVFRVGASTIWEGRNLYDLYSEACTPWDWVPMLKEIADEIGLLLFSTPFDVTAVDFLDEVGVPAYKIASFEIVDLALVRRVAATGRPIILSTGMATMREIEAAVQAVADSGGTEVALLKCTSAYPAKTGEMNLRTISHLAQHFGVPCGLSDHTIGTTVAVAAVALGAVIIEKHFTLTRDVPGPDSVFSMEPDEFADMARAIRTVDEALGDVRYGPTASEEPSLVFRRSLFVVDDVRKGDVLTTQNVRCIRPGVGLHPRHLNLVIGSRASRDVKRGTPLDWDLIDAARPQDSAP